MSAQNLADTNAQPAPAHNDKPAVWSLVMRDMTERDIFGAEKYGTRLQPGNGRDFLLDAYQESLDLVVYLRGAIYERDEAATVKESLTVHPVHPATFDHIDQADVEPASAIDDSSERMQIIGQSGEMASEVYAAVDSVDPWSGAPEWAKYKAQDCNGCWYWFDFMPEQHNIEWRVGHSRGVALYASPGDKNPNWACTLIARK